MIDDSEISFEIRYANGNLCIGGSQAVSEIDKVYNKLKYDSYCIKCDVLEIKSWIGKHDKIITRWLLKRECLQRLQACKRYTFDCVNTYKSLLKVMFSRGICNIINP